MRAALAVSIAALITASSAFAGQAPAPLPRGHIEIDGAYRATSTTFVDSAAPTINAEPARIATSYDVPAATGFSASGAVRVWRMIGIGVGVSRHSSSADGNISASIPHPFVFAQLRSFEGTARGVKREELNVALQLRGLLPVSNRLTVSLFAGPAWTSLSQEVVTAVNYSETYPYDSASFRTADRTAAKETKVGIGAGADVAYFFSRLTGIGLGLKYSGGTVALPSLDGGTVESKIGGVTVAAGVRFRF
jgi:opacity protein-like surface antigen